MIPPDDFPGDMDKFPVFPDDSHDADAVFGAASGTQPVPEDFGDVAELVRAARRSGTAHELAGEDVIVAQIVAAMGEHAASPVGGAHERIRVLSKFRSAKVAAASTAVLLLGGTAAAAATGALPSPVQHSVASGLSGMGIDLPTHHNVELAATHASPATKVKALHHEHSGRAPGAFGAVASVNGVSDPNACGGPGVDGTFTLTGRKGATFTVNVGASTTYVDKGVTGPTFVNVCVGDVAAAQGTVVGAVVTATKVFVGPPRPPHVPDAPSGARGIVASVNGVSAANTCGVPGPTGVFTLTGHKGTTFTVNVDTSTIYTDPAVSSPTFLTVCVGAFVAAKGAVVDTTVTATDVSIVPTPAPHDGEHHHGVFGTVASVNGLTTSSTCGGSGAPGTFTLTDRKGTTFTVSVDGSTKFRMPGDTAPTFVNVCVGAKVGVEGDLTGMAVTATGVFVFPTAMGHHDGDHGHEGFGSFPNGAASPGNTHVDSHDGAEHHSTGSGTSGGSGVSGSKVVSNHRARHGH